MKPELAWHTWESIGPLLRGRYILAFGLFGFAGGITNWLAVKMLFDEIPGVYGSGIIPKQFKQIRNTIKEMIMVGRGGGGVHVDPGLKAPHRFSKVLL